MKAKNDNFEKHLFLFMEKINEATNQVNGLKLKINIRLSVMILTTNDLNIVKKHSIQEKGSTRKMFRN